ncbi:MAG: head-tail adaptor protein [Eubacteriales bacterium]
MNGIGGNITAIIQTSTVTKNEIGETVRDWNDAQRLKGWLDLTSGDSRYTYNAKIQESTHIFVSDFVKIANGIEAENSRIIINGRVYEILLIDNPMEMGRGSQLEFYLRFTGGQ